MPQSEAPQSAGPAPAAGDGLPPLAVILMGIQVLAWLAVALTGEKLDALLLLRAGGNAVYEVQHGEIWRLLTASFLHAGLPHLLPNLVALYLVGPAVEAMLGRAGFLLIYFAAAILGSAGSLHFLGPYGVGVGASGGILGLVGAFVIASLRSHVPKPSGGVLARAVVAVALTLGHGWRTPGVDAAAHTFGLLTGCALAALLPSGRTSFGPGTTARPLGLIAAVTSLAASLVVTLPDVPVGLRQVLASQRELEQGRQALERTCLALELLKYGDQRFLPGWQLTQRLHEVHIPQARTAVAHLEQVRLPEHHPRILQSRQWLRQGQDLLLMLRQAPSVQDVRWGQPRFDPRLVLTWALSVGCTPPPRAP